MHKADTVQAFSAERLSLAVRHQPSSRKHRLNWHRGCRRRQVNAGQLTEGWVNANTRILGPEVKYIIGRSSRGHITSDFDSSLETQQLVPIGRGKIYWVILGIKGLKQYWILKKFSYPVIPVVVDLILITVIKFVAVLVNILTVIVVLFNQLYGIFCHFKKCFWNFWFLYSIRIHES